MTRDQKIGILSGLGAGALWGTVFIAPSLTSDFTALQISAARYIAYGIIAIPLLAPGWRRLSLRLLSYSPACRANS